MRIIFTVVVVSLLACYGCAERESDVIGKKLAIKDLRDDFTYFRLILESVHPGLYQYSSEKEMNHRFDSIFATLDEDAGYVDFYNKLSPVVNSIHDGHTYIGLPFSFLEAAHKTAGYFPIPVNAINGRLIVNSITAAVPLGAEITSVNKEPVSVFLNKLSGYEPVDGFNRTYQYEENGWDFATNYFKYKGFFKSFEVGYKKDSSPDLHKVNVEGITYEKVLSADRFFVLPEDVNYDMEIFDDEGYALLTVYTFGYDTWSTDNAFENFIKNSFRLLKKTPEVHDLIIDLRNNTGGNFHNMFHLYGYLTRRDEWKEFKNAYTVFNRIPFTPYLTKGENDIAGIQASIDSTFSSKKEGRSERQYKDNETMYPSDYRFGGNIYLITNSNVQSAAAYFAALMKDEGRAKIVGDETGGSGSSTNSFHLLTYELPHTKIKLTVPVVHAEFSLASGKQVAGRGVTPDFPILFTVKDLVENKDPQLNFVLDSLLK